MVLLVHIARLSFLISYALGDSKTPVAGDQIFDATCRNGDQHHREY
jgi:hypothetical protein